MNKKPQQKNPQRMCVCCRQMFDKRALLRIVRTPEGLVCIDDTGKKNGRGAYVCAQPACAEKCAKGVLRRHLGCDVPPEIYEEIKKRNGAQG